MMEGVETNNRTSVSEEACQQSKKKIKVLKNRGFGNPVIDLDGIGTCAVRQRAVIDPDNPVLDLPLSPTWARLDRMLAFPIE
ncbi:hypothetical protein MLD38_008627 [Melastoma candidum]|uniref:Uncharacterized protein n=1 Tax=Melastoma candidum TaxID=119954 RepID=A0ACB9RUC8_9MYRT|nr:hypothetical protein MLD38_008627 [Melastoma candidum]